MTVADAIPFYPVNDFGPAMKGMVIGGLGIFHVFLAQFAIGGGMLLCYFQWLAQTGREPNARRFLDGYFKVLVLVSFVTGALTGVAMWFTTIQVSARTIGLMVDEFHWMWAIEWTFFCLEITAGYVFYRYGDRLPDRIRLRLLIAYAIAAWMSLFWINGILAWQLTPGAWLDSGSVWAGFFNPSFWPSLIFRTVVSMCLAALVAAIVINTMDLDREARRKLILRAAHLLAPMALMPPLGLWFLAVIPEDSRTWLMGGSIAMTMFVAIAAGASVLIGGYAAIGLLKQRLYINGATATLLLALAFGATGAGEFVREGARKPYTVRQVLYSNSITPGEIAGLRRDGSVTDDPYPLRDAARYPTEQLRLGAKVYRLQCSVCHTMTGGNALVHLAGSWTPDQLRMNIAQLQHTKTFMPPFAGPAREVEAVAQLVMWEAAGAPPRWPQSDGDAAALAKIAAWLDDAGTEPGRAGQTRIPRGGPVNLPDGTLPYLVLYLTTLVVHVVLVGYVLLGVGWLAVTGLLGRRDGAIGAAFRDWLPFAVGAAITAGVAPLLFVQVLYQERFYTANLLLSHRWMAVIPALILGFYAVYVAKSQRAATWSPRWRAAAASVAALCFGFVALSWTENHLLSLRPDRWAPMYGTGAMVHHDVQLLPRLLLWLSAAVPIGATVMAWQVAADRAALKRLAQVVAPALAVVAIAAIWLYTSLTAAQRDLIGTGAGPLTMIVGGAAALGVAIGWVLVPRAHGSRLLLALPSTMLLIGLAAGAVLRERLRLPALAPIRDRVADAGGMALFLGFFVLNAAVIVWCIRTARRHLGQQ